MVRETPLSRATSALVTRTAPLLATLHGLRTIVALIRQDTPVRAPPREGDLGASSAGLRAAARPRSGGLAAPGHDGVRGRDLGTVHPVVYAGGAFMSREVSRCALRFSIEAGPRARFTFEKHPPRRTRGARE
ncbi:hypothetical protein CPE01_25190 [Cellulomonas persica]|uniref:Uncharacterized protein n=1 Tax=Cellulomonas persica TaxID=76861 RepID=A0A510UWA6_9CELL|nr:hypothetical protein CPE01_25190 [Cellulomonas persica]